MWRFRRWGAGAKEIPEPRSLLEDDSFALLRNVGRLLLARGRAVGSTGHRGRKRAGEYVIETYTQEK